MTSIKNILNSRLFFWIILAIPSIPMIADLFLPSRSYGGLMHGSGEFSSRFLVITLLISPLMFLTNKSRAVRWVMQRRRYIGLAAFGYSLLHTVFYLREIGMTSTLWTDLASFGILTGWAAFFIFVPLAITSNDAAVRRMGPSWKTLQRFSYVAAIFTCLHWALIGHLAPALIHFVPVLIGFIYATWRRRTRHSIRA